MNEIVDRARAYRGCVAESLDHFPPGPAFSLVNWGQHRRPVLHTYLPPGEKPDRYSTGFTKRLESMGVATRKIDRPESALESGAVVDISERLGRKSNRFPGVLEIQQAVSWYGLEHFDHLRSQSIRKTVKYFDRLMAVTDLLSDDLSKKTLQAIVTDQLTGIPLEIQPLITSYDTQYFGTGLFDLASNEVVVDAGAANGDSIEKFRQKQPHFEKWFAFEPDPILHPKLLDYIRENTLEGKVVPEKTPLVERSGTVHMKIRFGTGTTALTGGPGSDVESYLAKSIDDYLAGQRISIIKMDVEGAELSLLRGAEQSIRNHRPKLLISVYHEIEDLFQIPEYISSLKLGYRFHLRNHTWWHKPDESWPGSVFCETVFYAV